MMPAHDAEETGENACQAAAIGAAEENFGQKLQLINLVGKLLFFYF